VVEDLLEEGLVGRGAKEERHARANLHRIELAKDLVGGPALRPEDDSGTFQEALAEDRIGQVGACLVERGDRVVLRDPASPESGDLRKDEPDPVVVLATASQLLEDARVASRLRLDERARSNVIYGWSYT
jgi:hypothetical protein